MKSVRRMPSDLQINLLTPLSSGHNAFYHKFKRGMHVVQQLASHHRCGYGIILRYSDKVRFYYGRIQAWQISHSPIRMKIRVFPSYSEKFMLFVAQTCPLSVQPDLYQSNADAD